jgi:hypothetical protein
MSSWAEYIRIVLVAQTEREAFLTKRAQTVNGRFLEGIWQYVGVVDFECFWVWLFNCSDI